MGAGTEGASRHRAGEDRGGPEERAQLAGRRPRCPGLRLPAHCLGVARRLTGVSSAQRLTEDRTDLQATVELLQVRVQSLMHMLALQEEELTRKVGLPHPPAPDRLQAFPLWGLPRPTRILFLQNLTPRCGRAERAKVTPSASSGCFSCLPTCRSSLQMPWSPSFLRSTDRCCAAGGRRCLSSWYSSRPKTWNTGTP